MAGDPSDLDIAAITDAFERRVREVCPEHLSLARALLDRLPPARWTLEWYLPWWLGRAYGVDDAVSRTIVLSNVLGLGSIRLQDDLTDGDVAPADIEAARTLATGLYEAALEPYRGWFEPASPFWGELDRRLTAWRRAWAGEDLAARGAPLHISAMVVSLLAGKGGPDPALEACLDQALEALVRYDHVADWEADLEAGRWNAFVAATSIGAQSPEARDRHRTTLRVALMTGEAAADQFSMIGAALLRAASLAASLDPAIPALEGHLRSFAAEVETWGSAFQRHYQSLGDRAARLLLHGTADA